MQFIFSLASLINFVVEVFFSFLDLIRGSQSPSSTWDSFRFGVILLSWQPGLRLTSTQFQCNGCFLLDSLKNIKLSQFSSITFSSNSKIMDSFLLVMRIPKLSLIFMINEGLTEIFKVKGKAQLPKIHRTYFHSYIFLPSGPKPHHLQANTILLNYPLLHYKVFFFFF